jgi:hypothetical protein
MLVKRRGIPCKCVGKFHNAKDGHYYCKRHINKIKNTEFKTINALVTQDCMVCMEPMNSTDCLSRSRCGHTFHRTCINDLKDNAVSKCPVCETSIYWDWEDDTIAKKVKYNSGPNVYAGFQMWCIQKKMGIRLIKSFEKNREFCTYSLLSPSLNKEMKSIEKLSPDILFDKLMTLCRDHPSVMQ